MSGHSKWHNIQAKKGKTDAAPGPGTGYNDRTYKKRKTHICR